METEVKLYQIPLPCARNDGKPYPMTTRQDFLRDVTRCAGGYTLLGDARGVWDDDGKLYVEQVTPLQVACDPGPLARIVSLFKFYYPDQLSIMVATLGDVEFIATRKK